MEKTKGWVRQYFGWIPKGPDTSQSVPQEPPQTESRRLVVYKANVPLTNIYMGFKTTDFKSDDHYALNILGDILASGRTGRLDRKFVTGDNPMYLSSTSVRETSSWKISRCSSWTRRFIRGKIRMRSRRTFSRLCTKSATKASPRKSSTKSARRRGRVSSAGSKCETCTQIATELGQEQVFGR